MLFKSTTRKRGFMLSSVGVSKLKQATGGTLQVLLFYYTFRLAVNVSCTAFLLIYYDDFGKIDHFGSFSHLFG